jgi:hypothetical protein
MTVETNEDPYRETNTHLRIHLYDAGPPPAEPLENTLCPQFRSQGEPLTDDKALVTCPWCQGLIDRLLL